jgi:hypothetical protein
MKPATASSRCRGRARRTGRASSAAPSGWNCWTRAPQRSSRGRGRTSIKARTHKSSLMATRCPICATKRTNQSHWRMFAFEGIGGLEPGTLRRRAAQRCSCPVFIRAGTATAGIGGRGPAPSRGMGLRRGPRRPPIRVLSGPQTKPVRRRGPRKAAT